MRTETKINWLLDFVHAIRVWPSLVPLVGVLSAARLAWYAARRRPEEQELQTIKNEVVVHMANGPKGVTIVWYARHDGESDDAYFVRILEFAKKRYPDMTSLELYYGVCDATGLDCLHPFNLLEYHGYSQGAKAHLLSEFFSREPPHRHRDKEYMKRVWSLTRCSVCGQWAPSQDRPVSIKRQRESRLAHLLMLATEEEP